MQNGECRKKKQIKTNRWTLNWNASWHGILWFITACYFNQRLTQNMVKKKGNHYKYFCIWYEEAERQFASAIVPVPFRAVSHHASNIHTHPPCLCLPLVQTNSCYKQIAGCDMSCKIEFMMQTVFILFILIHVEKVGSEQFSLLLCVYLFYFFFILICLWIHWSEEYMFTYKREHLQHGSPSYSFVLIKVPTAVESWDVFWKWELSYLTINAGNVCVCAVHWASKTHIYWMGHIKLAEYFILIEFFSFSVQCTCAMMPTKRRTMTNKIFVTVVVRESLQIIRNCGLPQEMSLIYVASSSMLPSIKFYCRAMRYARIIRFILITSSLRAYILGCSQWIWRHKQ